MGLTEKYFDKFTETGIPEFVLRLLCGLGNAVVSTLTFGLLPFELVLNILLKYVAPVFGFDYSKLEALQKESAKEIATFNSFNNTNFVPIEIN